MTKKNLFFIFSLTFSLQSFSQKPPENDAEFEKAYQRNIKKDFLHGVYIPKDLGDAFVQLNKLIDKDSKASFKSLPEDQVTDKLFFSFGRWIVHNWSFYGGSRLSHYIKNLGIHHPEDMARFVMIMYHRNLNKKPLDVKNLLAEFNKKQEDAKKKLLENGEILHEAKRLRDTTSSGN